MTRTAPCSRHSAMRLGQFRAIVALAALDLDELADQGPRGRRCQEISHGFALRFEAEAGGALTLPCETRR